MKNSRRKRPIYSAENKALAVALYKRAPRSYRFLQKFFVLPSKMSIQRYLRQIPIDSGINEIVLSKLRESALKLDDLDKYCCLSFDEMFLAKGFQYDESTDKVFGYVDMGSLGRYNEFGTRALVFMLQGLHKSWKQPVAFYYTNGGMCAKMLAHLIKEIIIEIQATGLKVVSTVCDQSSVNIKALSELSCGANNDIFFVNNQKVIPVIDPPHLLKNTRNTLQKYKIAYGENNEKIANFEHIEQCFKIDRTMRFRSLPKIKEYYFNSHLSSVKMKVSYAAKILSRSVASSIECMVVGNILPAESVFTAEFVHDMDLLFDSCNSKFSSAFDEYKSMRRAVTSKSPHPTFWKEMLQKISTWKFIGEKTSDNLPVKKGWLHTIQALLEIWSDLQSVGFSNLRTRSLNQDPLENLFGIIRQTSGSDLNPTCYHFL